MPSSRAAFAGAGSARVPRRPRACRRAAPACRRADGELDPDADGGGEREPAADPVAEAEHRVGEDAELRRRRSTAVVTAQRWWVSVSFADISSTSQARAARALARVSTVVKVLEMTTTSVLPGREVGQYGVELGRVDVGDEVDAYAGVVRAGGRSDHAWAEVGATDADHDDVGDAVSGDASDGAPEVTASTKSLTLRLVCDDLRDDVDAIDERCARLGSRAARCAAPAAAR